MHVGCAGSVHDLSRLERIFPCEFVVPSPLAENGGQSPQLFLPTLFFCSHVSPILYSDPGSTEAPWQRENVLYDGDVCGSPCLAFASSVPSIFMTLRTVLSFPLRICVIPGVCFSSQIFIFFLPTSIILFSKLGGSSLSMIFFSFDLWPPTAPAACLVWKPRPTSMDLYSFPLHCLVSESLTCPWLSDIPSWLDSHSLQAPCWPTFCTYVLWQ